LIIFDLLKRYFILLATGSLRTTFYIILLQMANGKEKSAATFALSYVILSVEATAGLNKICFNIKIG
jgi:hypothetical protein